MMNGSTNTALRQVARVFQEGTLTGLSDGQTLARFVESRDEAAFEALVGRHGPMVYRVCRQLLRDPHDAEDAFQAVFLVLIRKSNVIQIEGSLGPWLYSVANRVAARARANRRRFATRSLPETAEIAASQAELTLDRDETTNVIHEELARLPERLRSPLVLCYLQGMTHELAAGQLGCPVGTVRSRLSRGRAQLHRRIARRGLTLSTAGLTSLLESNATAVAVPPALRIALIRLATAYGAKTAVRLGGLGATASATTLLEGVLSAMRIKKFAIMATVLLGAGALALVIADRAAAVDEYQLQQELAPAGRELPLSAVSPDTKPSASSPANPRPEMITITYYIGDIVGVKLPDHPRSTSPESDKPQTAQVMPKVNFEPVMNLISSTIVPGTWQMNGGFADGEDRKTNAMVPFYLSISLIVRCPNDVHKQVGNLLHRLRGVLNARDARMRVPDQSDAAPARRVVDRMTLEPGPSSAPTDPTRDIQPTIAPRKDRSPPANAASRQRVQQLLDELQTEIAKLPAEKQ